jgi:signal transduction histidine kinase
MNIKKIFKQLNISAECGRYGLPLWQCPPFLFLMMGLIIIGSALIAYGLGTRFIENPETVALIVLILTAVLFVVAFAITRSFERLVEVNRMKSEFVKIVSHQLRSPITNLSWTIDILMSGQLGKVEGKYAEYFKILKENSTRMIDLVGDLLTVSRIEEGSLIIKREKISIEPIIKKLISRFKPFVLSSNIEIKFEAGENLPQLFIDVHQIEIVIENLFDNAIRYIKEKGEIKVKLQQRDKTLYFEIKDTGVGIPKDDQKFIFQKFFRSENAIRQQTQGSGLGLFIAKSIIERFDGQIGFESEENKGSTFWFTLPINK